jgi:hypothetical protein
VQFRLDRAGTYVVRLTSRGVEPVINAKDGKVNLGASLGGGLYSLVVVGLCRLNQVDP